METHTEQYKVQYPATAGELRFLDPARVRLLTHGATLRLTVEDECSWLKVTALRTLPLSDPDRHISLRDEQGQEIGLIVEPGRLDMDSRAQLGLELKRRYLIPRILEVVAAAERFGTVDWTVRTDRGTCRFTTRHLHENVVSPAPGRYLLTDVDGNRFDVPDIQKLDAASRATLLLYM